MKYTAEDLIQDRITLINHMSNGLISALDAIITDYFADEDESDIADFTYHHVYIVDKLRCLQILRQHFKSLLNDDNEVSPRLRQEDLSDGTSEKPELIQTQLDLCERDGDHVSIELHKSRVDFFDDLSYEFILTLGFAIHSYRKNKNDIDDFTIRHEYIAEKLSALKILREHCQLLIDNSDENVTD